MKRYHLIVGLTSAFLAAGSAKLLVAERLFQNVMRCRTSEICAGRYLRRICFLSGQMCQVGMSGYISAPHQGQAEANNEGEVEVR